MSFETSSAALAALLNRHKIEWGFGGSCLLYFIGIPVTPRDLDVVIRYSDVEAARAALLADGAVLLEERPSNNQYLTRKFYTFQWGDMEVDLMAAPGIRRGDRIFEMDFDGKGPWKTVTFGGETIKLSDPADWLAYYSLMENRQLRVEQLANYLEGKK